jgi:hypothetical protein
MGRTLHSVSARDEFHVDASKVTATGIADTIEISNAQDYRIVSPNYSLPRLMFNGMVAERNIYVSAHGHPASELQVPTGIIRLQPPLDMETEDMCQRNGLMPYINLLDRKIHEIYPNVKDIRHRRLVLPGLPDYERLRFEIHLSGDPEEILRAEKQLHAFLFEKVPEDKQDFFSLTYRVTRHESP